MRSFYSFPPLKWATKAYTLVKKGEYEKAKEIFKNNGCKNPDKEVEQIRNFLKKEDAKRR